VFSSRSHTRVVLSLASPPFSQRSRAEEEGKWDAVSKAIQKVQLLFLFADSR
jgi:hypothetical protein